MNIREELIDLDAAVRGRDRLDDPYADGFYVISDYLASTSRTLRDQLDACLAAMQEQKRADVRAAFSSPKNSQLF